MERYFLQEIEMLGRNIKSWRELRGLSQSELGASIEVSKQTVSNIETGAKPPTLQTFFKIADALRLRPQQLFDTPPTLKPDALKADRMNVDNLTAADVPLILDRLVNAPRKIRALVVALLMDDEHLIPEDLAYILDDMNSLLKPQAMNE